jgi:hypothetical protein
MALEQDLLAIEKRLWTGGPEDYRAATDDQCLVVFSSMAGVWTRDDIAKSAEKGRWRDPVLTPKGFLQLSDSSVVVSYECMVARKDGRAHHAYVSSGYVKRADGWKLAFHQQTEVKPTAP